VFKVERENFIAEAGFIKNFKGVAVSAPSEHIRLVVAV
jgi:hypothetical protein